MIGKALAGRKSLSFGFILLPNFTLLGLASFVEVLRVFCDEATNVSSGSCRWSILCCDEGNTRSSGGLQIGPSAALVHPEDYDFVVLVGGKRPRSEALPEEVSSFLAAAARASTPIVSLSGGTFDLARLGMLDGRSVCVHWDQLREFNIEFPEIEASADKIFLVDGDRITCAGGTYVIDLAVFLLARHFGDNALRMTLALMGIQSIRQPTHMQEHIVRAGSAGNTERISRLVRLIETRTDLPPSVQELAERVNVSPRHLARIVKQAFDVTPRQLSTMLRLRRAQWLICNTNKSIAQVAYDCGFADSSHLIRDFKRAFGLTPTRLRRSHSAAMTTEFLTENLRRWGQH